MAVVIFARLKQRGNKTTTRTPRRRRQRPSSGRSGRVDVHDTTHRAAVRAVEEEVESRDAP